MKTPHPDYRDIIREAFETRTAHNSHYSLRAFARDLNLSPASLSLILNGQQGLSRTSATRVAKGLALSPAESQRFCDLVDAQHARSPRQRQLAQIRLKKHDTNGETLQLDAFRVMSDWYHFAILELTMIEGFESSSAWIARNLGIRRQVVEMAITRLKKLELLEEVGGQLRQTTGFLATPSGIPSDSLKKFHQQILKKAEAALLTQPVEERDFSAIVFPVSKADLPWAKTKLKEFRRSFMEKLEEAPMKERVYCLSIQFFDLQSRPAPVHSTS